MKIKIYQINSDRDKNNVKFMGREDLPKWQSSPDVDSALYDEVFSGDVDCGGLESVYTLFNTDIPALHRGHSLSVSDVVATEDGAYYCDRIGFEKIEFDESKTQKQKDLLQVVYVEPNKPAYFVFRQIGHRVFRLSQARAVRIRSAVHTVCMPCIYAHRTSVYLENHRDIRGDAYELFRAKTAGNVCGQRLVYCA